MRGPTLPYWAPTGKLFDVRSCSALYLSTGIVFKHSPGQQLQHATWIPLEQSAGINHEIGFTLNRPITQLHHPITILKYGKASVVLKPSSYNSLQILVQHPGRAPVWPVVNSPPIIIRVSHPNRLSIMTDPYKHTLEIRLLFIKRLANGRVTANGAAGQGLLEVYHYLAGPGPAVVVPSSGPTPVISVFEVHNPPPTMSLCRSLQKSG